MRILRDYRDRRALVTIAHGNAGTDSCLQEDKKEIHWRSGEANRHLSPVSWSKPDEKVGSRYMLEKLIVGGQQQN